MVLIFKAIQHAECVIQTNHILNQFVTATSYRDLLVTGSFITIHSVISPYLQKCSRRPSAHQHTGQQICTNRQFSSTQWLTLSFH